MPLPLLGLGLIGTLKTAIITSLFAALAAGALSLVTKIVVGLGLGYIVYEGVGLSLAVAFDEIKVHLGQLPIDMLSIIAYLQIDKMIQFIFSAYAVRAAFKTATLGAVFARR